MKTIRNKYKKKVWEFQLKYGVVSCGHQARFRHPNGQLSHPDLHPINFSGREMEALRTRDVAFWYKNK